MATIAENIQTLKSIKSDIKNAIIQKGGSVTDAFGTYAQAITNLPSGGGGGTEIEDALVEGTISEYYNDRISRVGGYAFAYYSALTSIDLPNCSYIGSNAFKFCSKLTSVNLPNCKYIDGEAFEGCSSLSSIDLPNCTLISNNAFIHCLSISIIRIPVCSSISNNIFYNCTNLTQVYLNSVTSVTTIQSNTFNKCPNLTSVYVPSSLVDAFKTAQYWSSISNKIVAYTGA